MMNNAFTILLIGSSHQKAMQELCNYVICIMNYELCNMDYEL